MSLFTWIIYKHKLKLNKKGQIIGRIRSLENENDGKVRTELWTSPRLSRFHFSVVLDSDSDSDSDGMNGNMALHILRLPRMAVTRGDANVNAKISLAIEK